MGRASVPLIAMNYVITSRCGTSVIEIGKIESPLLNIAKASATKLLTKKGYFPCERLASERGKWFHSVSNPHWVLRGKPKRYFRNENGDMLCVYLVSYDDRLFDLCPKKGNSHLPEPLEHGHMGGVCDICQRDYLFDDKSGMYLHP